MGLLTNLALFAGAGGLELGARKCGGFRTVGYVERDRYAQGVLMSRIRGGELDDAPIWDDVTTFDGRPWRGLVDVVSGGFPCQPHSCAGKKLGAADERNLWPAYLRIVRECRPSFVLAENVLGIFNTGYALEVLADLEEAGYCATPIEACACEAGAPHPRTRVFFLAHAKSAGWRPLSRHDGARSAVLEPLRCGPESVWSKGVPSELARMADGVAFRMDRIRCCGNGVVPDQSVPIWSVVKKIAQNLAVKK